MIKQPFRSHDCNVGSRRWFIQCRANSGPETKWFKKCRANSGHAKNYIFSFGYSHNYMYCVHLPYKLTLADFNMYVYL